MQEDTAPCGRPFIPEVTNPKFLLKPPCNEMAFFIGKVSDRTEPTIFFLMPRGTGIFADEPKDSFYKDWSLFLCGKCNQFTAYYSYYA